MLTRRIACKQLVTPTMQAMIVLTGVALEPGTPEVTETKDMITFRYTGTCGGLIKNIMLPLCPLCGYYPIGPDYGDEQKEEKEQ